MQALSGTLDGHSRRERGDPAVAAGAQALRARAPARPMLWVALALAAGAGSGLLREGATIPWALLAAGAGGAWAGRAHLFRGGSAPAPGRRPGVPLILLLFALGGLRATGPPGSPPPGRGVAETLEGIWEPEPGAGGLRGALVDGPRRIEGLELPEGIARRGERLRLLSWGDPVAPARGPFGSGGAALAPVRADEVVRLAAAPSWLPSALRRPLERARSHLEERCDALPDPGAAALARALVCGDASRLDPAVADLFTRTGVRHLLAVSGTHVGLIALLLLGPLSLSGGRLVPRAWRRPWHARALLALLLLAYIPLSGAGAPVRRAALAAALAAVAPARWTRPGARAGRWPDALSLWALALALECACDPRALLSISLQLSYSATLGMILAAGVLQRALAPRAHAVQPLAPTGPWRALGACAARGGRWLRAGFAASAVAILATLPIAWRAWGEVSPLGALVTTLCLPPCALLMLGGWLHALVPAAEPWLAPAVSRTAAGLLDLLRAVDLLPGTPYPLPMRPWPAVLATCALTLAGLSARAARARSVGLRAAALAWGCLLLPWSAAPRGLELWALDVGHGTAVALRGPGCGTWILDCGSRDRKRVAQQALAPLLAAWESGPPRVVLTHEDRDHAGGLEWLVERRPPSLWAGALPALQGERLPHTVPRVALAAGSAELFRSERSGLRLRLLRGRDASGNEGSYSLLVSLRGRHGLLTGDAEDGGLADLLRLPELPRSVELLLVPHHGSDSPWLGALLDRCAPGEAWISAARAPPAIRELDRRGIPWRLTSRDGPLSSGLDGL